MHYIIGVSNLIQKLIVVSEINLFRIFALFLEEQMEKTIFWSFWLYEFDWKFVGTTSNVFPRNFLSHSDLWLLEMGFYKLKEIFFNFFFNFAKFRCSFIEIFSCLIEIKLNQNEFHNWNFKMFWTYFKTTNLHSMISKFERTFQIWWNFIDLKTNCPPIGKLQIFFTALYVFETPFFYKTLQIPIDFSTACFVSESFHLQNRSISIWFFSRHSTFVQGTPLKPHPILML